MSYDETIGYLYSLQKYGIKFGLDNIGKLAAALGNPHESFPCAHVAGTNGKGSTAAVIASILQAAGHRVGLFTSPHLISFTERIRINGEEITEAGVIDLASEIRDIVSRFDDFNPTFFEVVTAIALLYFQRQKADAVVMETGMGGRLDATNIVTPLVSVITNISFDHKYFLGNTLNEIAAEKAGIIKKGIPVVSADQEPEAAKVVREKARELSSALYLYGKDFSALLKKSDASGICFDYSDGSIKLKDLTLPLSGEHQMRNASLAVKAADLFLNSPRLRVSASPRQDSSSRLLKYIRDGLASTKWPGRLELVQSNPPILIDGAHNPAAAHVLSKTIKSIFLNKYKKIIMVLGIMSDKDMKGIMGPLLPLASEIIVTAPSYERAASPGRLAEIAASLGFSDIRISSTVKEAIDLAIKDGRQMPDSPLIVITGSFYTIGEAMEALGRRGILTRLREC
ncbi:MAG: folylpolyglutamate synthase/dihydrofolate synthase family protein [Thermodesulfovibrionales bacterium]